MGEADKCECPLQTRADDRVCHEWQTLDFGAKQESVANKAAWRQRGMDEPSAASRRKPRRAGIKRQPGRLFFGYFLLATHKFAWSKFEQPKAGPKGENQGWFS